MPSIKNQLTVIFVWLGIALLAGCAGKQSDSMSVDTSPSENATTTEAVASSPPAVYAFSMLAPGNGRTPVIFARIVYDAVNQACPVLKGSDQSTLTTSKRPKNPFTSGAQISDKDFPVTVCEAIISPGVTYNNQRDGISLAAVSLDPQNIQVYGDSGCKVSDCGESGVSSDFLALANHGATQPHDLILHMGDYNYRGTSGHFAKSSSGHDIYAYDAGDIPTPIPSCTYNDTYYSQNSTNSPKPDSWLYWKPDFFEAAKTLLPTAPWVFARGNHELCSRAGVGWFYFLGQGSVLVNSGMNQLQCPDQGNFNKPPANVAQQIEMIPPYMVELANLQVWVMDSANACDAFHSNPLTKQYKKQYDQLNALTVNNKPTWVMSHRPIWGYQGGGSINNMLQAALTGSTAKKLPSAVLLSLAGHMHIYETLTFVDGSGKATGRPPQIVIGNSGVKLSGAPGAGPNPNIDGQSAIYTAARKFGYLQMAVQGSGDWSGQVTGENGSAIANCNSSNIAAGGSICTCSASDTSCATSTQATN